ncbi:hypothetical protein C2M27_00170 [Escherichia coli]|nr:hypothetical protein C2M27_00170 [Escherichia coli]
MTDFGGKTSIFSHPVYLFLRKFSLQDSRGGSQCNGGFANGSYSMVQSRRSCSASNISPVCEACRTLLN